MKTSLELSKKLKDNECELESEFYWAYCKYLDTWTLEFSKRKTKKGFLVTKIYPALDILNDICVKHAKEFFGENYLLYTEYIFTLIQLNEIELKQNKIKDEIEEYIWEHCSFNDKNK